MREWRMKSFLFCALLVSLWGNAGCAISCYQCNSRLDKNCENVKKNTNKVGGCDYCVMLHQTILGNEETGDIYHRDCKHGKSKTECLKRELRNSVRTEACKCSTSLCNSAPPGGPRAAPANHWVTLATLVVMVAVLTSVF